MFEKAFGKVFAGAGIIAHDITFVASEQFRQSRAEWVHGVTNGVARARGINLEC